MSLMTGLVGCWEWNDTPPFTASSVDLSGNGNHAPFGTAPPAKTSGPGLFSSAIILPNVSGQRITTPIMDAFVEFTCAVWFSPYSSPAGYERLVDKSYSTGFWLGTPGAAQWGGGVQEGPPYGIYLTFPASGWSHIVSRRYIQSGSGIHHIIGNGGALSTSNTVSTTPLDATANFFIGADSTNVAQGSSTLAQICLWNRALDDLEISNHYNNGNGLPYPFNIRRMGRPIGSRIIGR